MSTYTSGWVDIFSSFLSRQLALFSSWLAWLRGEAPLYNWGRRATAVYLIHLICMYLYAYISI